MSEKLEHLSDWDLLELCKNRDEPAWEELVDRHAERLRLSVRAQLGVRAKDIHFVEDVCQEVLVALIDEGYRRLGLYNPQRGCFKTFLGVVANEVIRRDRRRSKRARAKKREVSLDDCEPADPTGNAGLAQAEFAEYQQSLSAQESRCLHEKLLKDADKATGPALSSVNEQVLKHRLRQKWDRHFDTP